MKVNPTGQSGSLKGSPEKVSLSWGPREGRVNWMKGRKSFWSRGGSNTKGQRWGDRHLLGGGGHLSDIPHVHVHRHLIILTQHCLPQVCPHLSEWETPVPRPEGWGQLRLLSALTLWFNQWPSSLNFYPLFLKSCLFSQFLLPRLCLKFNMFIGKKIYWNYIIQSLNQCLLWAYEMMEIVLSLSEQDELVRNNSCPFFFF